MRYLILRESIFYASLFLFCCSFKNFNHHKRFIKYIQLAFEGNRSGEGYFSASGKDLLPNENHPEIHIQIYTLNLDGVAQLVSTGIGKSTCAWFHPSETKMLYASTHLDPKSHQKQKREFELRKSGTSRKYSWDYDPNYDLFLNDLKANSNKRLTREYGYDAECAFSKWRKNCVYQTGTFTPPIQIQLTTKSMSILFPVLMKFIPWIAMGEMLKD